MFQVVPFSQRSGVLEWCSGTVPIGEFLVDTRKGAHKRFRPQDWSSMDCRRKMMVRANDFHPFFTTHILQQASAMLFYFINAFNVADAEYAAWVSFE